MRKFLLLVLILIIPFSLLNSFGFAYAGNSKNNLSISDLIEKLDTEEIDKILSSFDENQKEIFNATSFKDKLLTIINGNGESFDNFFEYIFSTFFSKFKNYFPFLFSTLGIFVAFGIINSFGSSTNSSVNSSVKFAFILIVSISVLSQVMSIIVSVKKYIFSLKNQIDVVFPLLMTIMAAVGTTKSVTIYKPAIAILSSGLVQLIVTIVIPCLLLSIVFNISSHFSDKIKLKNLSSFFNSIMKWLLGTSFFVFLSFLSLKGITASIYDNMYIRTTKFALNKYIPIIGGYLSEGYNLVFSGSIIIKNGIGLCSVIILLLSLIPLFVEIILFTLCLDLLCALGEPIGASDAAIIFKGLSKSIKNLLAIVLGISFLYFIFILLIVCTGNISLWKQLANIFYQ